MKAVPESRWRKAQNHELDFWTRFNFSGPYRNLDLHRYWQEECSRMGLDEDLFRGKRVLDVGCGPVGLIHFLPQAALRVRVDPLLPQYASRMPLTGPSLSLSAVGERLPLATGSVDVAICFNALDHMQDPERALRELTRVLVPGGTLILMVHTFPKWTLPLLKVDRMHPHHWTRTEFFSAVSRHVEALRTNSIRRKFDIPLRDWLKPASWKYLAAEMVVSTTYAVGTTPCRP